MLGCRVKRDTYDYINVGVEMKVIAGLLASISIVLAGCGGGGGGYTETTQNNQPVTTQNNQPVPKVTVSGIVMDGYLKDATVFLDLNDNGVYDSGEPTALTDASGAYSFNAASADISAHAVIAIATPGVTVDMDNPLAPITSRYTLTSPVGKNTVISPITTLVAAKINSGLSVAAAEAAVKTDLGMTSIDVYKNYIDAKKTDTTYQQLHNLAAATAKVLMNVESTTIGAPDLTQKLTQLSTKFLIMVGNQVSAIKSARDAGSAVSIVSDEIPKSGGGGSSSTVNGTVGASSSAVSGSSSAVSGSSSAVSGTSNNTVSGSSSTVNGTDGGSIKNTISGTSTSSSTSSAVANNGVSSQGGGSSTNVSIEGAWTGTTSNNYNINLLVLENNELWNMFGTTSGNNLLVSGFDQGSGSVNGSSVNASLKEYLNGSAPYAVTAVTISGTAVAGTSIKGSLAYSGGSGTFSVAPMPVSSFNYDQAAKISDVQGTWNGLMLNGLPANLTIASTGTLSGSNNGCLFNGTATPRSSGKNVLNISVSFGAAPCALPGQTMTGIALSYKTITNQTQLIIAAVDASKSNGTAFLALR